MYSISIFYLAYYLFGGAYAYGPDLQCSIPFFRSIKIIDILNRSTAKVPVMIIHYTRTFSDDNQVLYNYFLYS